MAAFAGTLFGLMLRVVCFNVATLKANYEEDKEKREKSLLLGRVGGGSFF